jgi:hypothetical protein
VHLVFGFDNLARLNMSNRQQLYDRLINAYLSANFDTRKGDALVAAQKLWNELKDDEIKVQEKIGQLHNQSKQRKSQNILSWAKLSATNTSSGSTSKVTDVVEILDSMVSQSGSTLKTNAGDCSPKVI